ncbi:MotE family protein [Pseudodesulfovibrio senegalensis]|jgi:flagellar motility protein MotE (MotC chaperone)|uniref:Magnesium transporter MgtE n=1 Tax=Pseudodesulfovibrio senegalensis TaxID=1721087 RepID=A0A6N6N5D7_9BACT|nr:magnesium transporter MgtE [Pseudodesulfovibrio senegalensis]KAB1442951.1 magnesium transporter MgtE [Pseudodesulfovibrio senegalensis]
MNVKISRILLSLVFLALLKLAVFGMLSVDSVTLEVAQAVLPDSALDMAKPAEAMAQEEEKNAPETAQQQASDESPAPQESAANPDANNLPDDWKALKKLQEKVAIEQRNNEELKAFIEAETKRLTKLRDEIKQMLAEAKDTKDKKVKQLIDMLSSTKAKKAAEILESMDQKLAVKVLSGMRGRTAGEILTFVEAKKAAQFSEALTRLQIPFEDQ